MNRWIFLLVAALTVAGAAAPVPAASRQAQLFALDGEAYDSVGRSVAVSGDTAVAGAIGDDTDGSSSGAAYVFKRVGLAWSQEAKLVPLDGAADDQFGHAVAISGDTIVVGAPYDDGSFPNQGSVYVFTRLGSVWTQQAKLMASDAGSYDNLGFSVAVSGETVVAGAAGYFFAGIGDESAYVFTRSGTAWTQQAKVRSMDWNYGGEFAFSVALSGDTLIVGAPNVGDNGTSSGATFAFARQGSVWTQQAKLLASDGVSYDKFGTSVSMSGDTAVVGAPGRGPALPGRAYVFNRSGSTWSQQAKLDAAETTDRFGSAVATFGDTAAVASNAGGGTSKVFFFARSGGTWTVQGTLRESPYLYAGEFGASLGLTGDTLVVGAPASEDLGSFSGSAFVFTGLSDFIPPAIAASVSPPANAVGWHRTSPVAVSFTCSDQGSGIASCPSPIEVGAQTSGQTVSGTAIDQAGNTASASTTIRLDTTAPTIAHAVTPPPNAAGWNTGPVTVSFTCADSRSGIATCPAPLGVSSETAGEIVAGSAVDVAGNTTSRSATVRIDSTAPTILASLSPAPNAASWNRTAVLVSFTCSDDRSGIQACPDSQWIFADTSGQVLTRSVSDRAGNAASVSVTVRIDSLPPQISPLVSSGANAAGWHRATPVTVSFSCADDRSGIASCPSTVTIANETPPLVVAGTAKDIAGNTTTSSSTVSIDLTPPTVTIDDPSFGTGLPLPALEITGTATDALAGIQFVEVTFTDTVTGAVQIRDARVDGNAWSVDAVGLGSGPTRVSARSTDIADNAGVESRSVLFLAVVP